MQCQLSHILNLNPDLLTLGSMHAEGLSWTISLPILVLIAQAIFLEHGQTKSQRQLSFLYHAGGLTDHHKHGIMRLVQRTCLCFLELTSVLLTGV